MKKLLILLVLNSQFLISNSFAQSPEWLWAKAMGGTLNDGGESIALDAFGNVYTTGSFNGTVDFDPGLGVFNLTSVGFDDIFISKSDSSGNFVWAKAMGGSTSDGGMSLDIDLSGSGNVYTTGWFEGTVDFDPGAGVFYLTSPGINYDIFISKLDSSGNFIWAIQLGGTDWKFSMSIAIDPSGSGDVYTTGHFDGTADFDPGASVFNLTSYAYLDIFVSKLDSSGNFMWAKRMGGIGIENSNSITIDPAGSGNIYATGNFEGTVDFDPGLGVFNLTAAGDRDIFISKLDNSGNFIWAKQIGGGGTDNANSIVINPAGSGDIYTTGFFVGLVDFDPGAGVFNLTSAGDFDIFISKLDSSGNFVWAKAIGGTGLDVGHSIAIDPAGNGAIYTTGQFLGTADFDPDSSGNFNLTAAGGDDIFISRLDGSGNFVWAKAVGELNYERGESIAVDDSGNVHLTGYFASTTITFGSTTLMNADNSGTTADIFIARLDTAVITGMNDVSPDGPGSLNLTRIFPNPLTNTTTISFSLSNTQNAMPTVRQVSLKIFDVNGSLVSILADKIFEAGEHQLDFNAEKINAGIYFLQFQTAEITTTKKLIITK